MQIDPQRLVAARLARAMSQEEAAIATDLSARTIQRIEAGQPAALESTKALLTIFGADIICEPIAPTAVASPSPGTRTSMKVAHWARLSASWAMGGVRLIFIAAMLAVAAGELVAPSHTGLFLIPPGAEQSFALGTLSGPPPGSEEILGFWVVPLMVLAAGLLALSFRRARHFATQLIRLRRSVR